MKNFLIYIDKFIPKQDLPLDLEVGKVYTAMQDGKNITLLVDGAQLWLNEGVTDSPVLYCEYTVLDKDNYKSLPLKPEDKVLAYSRFEADGVIKKAIQGVREENDRIIESAIADLEFLNASDPGMLHSIAQVLSHITATYEDKYEDSPVDIYMLMRDSDHGAGFNVGNALKYLKRYLTVGYEKSSNIEDLFKAIHYQLFQIENHRNG